MFSHVSSLCSCNLPHSQTRCWLRSTKCSIIVSGTLECRAEITDKSGSITAAFKTWRFCEINSLQWNDCQWVPLKRQIKQYVSVMLNLTSHKAAPLIDGKPSWHRWLFTGNKDGEPKMEEAIKGYQLFMRHPLLFNLLCWSKGSVTLQTWSLDNYRTEVDTKSWISYFTNQTNLLAC